MKHIMGLQSATVNPVLRMRFSREAYSMGLQSVSVKPLHDLA